MKFISTRDAERSLGFSQALQQGLAPDGGLYVPTQWPNPSQVVRQSQHLAEIAEGVIAPFVSQDPAASALRSVCQEAFNFPLTLKPVGSTNLRVLELFHGPTAAFKDFGARFLAAWLSNLQSATEPTLRILVATSGDTGGAVAAAFHRRPKVAVTVLFPQGLVSPTQQQQLTCWGDNVQSLAVQGSFDDCQRMVKEAFVDPALQASARLSSANSINLGRLLPQSVYYAASSLEIAAQTGRKASYIIPSGNLGNAVACVWARQMGFPIERIVLALNANRTVSDFLATHQWTPRPSVPTLASAMDVGHPSNMERLRALFPDVLELKNIVSADNVSDEQIRARIQQDFARWGEIWCPHTATAAEVYARMDERQQQAHAWVMVATAHPAKFREICEPLVGPIALPANLAMLFERPTHFNQIEPTLVALRNAARF